MIRYRTFFAITASATFLAVAACDAVLPLGNTPCLDGCDGGVDGGGHLGDTGDAGAPGDGGTSFTDPDAGSPVCDGSDCACIGTFKKGNQCMRASALFAHGAAICAIADGTPYCWGTDFLYFRHYDGPATIPGLEGGVAGLALGEGHGCARTAAGGIRCWGSNDVGQLGNGRQNAPTEAVDAVGLAQGATSVFATESHACAITAAGGIECWGNDNFGQLGAGTDAGSSSLPLDVAGLPAHASTIEEDWYTVCSLLQDGHVACWGDNSYGAFGPDRPADNRAPFLVNGLDDAVSLSINQAASCALDRSGKVLCWGSNKSHLLGPSGTPDNAQPTPVGPLASSRTAWLGLAEAYACVITATAGVKCWGDSPGGMIDPTATSSLDVPSLGAGVVRLTVGVQTACAVMSGGAVRCWGDNHYGQLGSGSSDERSDDPVAVAGLPEPVADVRFTAQGFCALTRNGYVWCWGDNSDGQLASDTSALPKSAVPVPIRSR